MNLLYRMTEWAYYGLNGLVLAAMLVVGLVYLSGAEPRYHFRIRDGGNLGHIDLLKENLAGLCLYTSWVAVWILWVSTRESDLAAWLFIVIFVAMVMASEGLFDRLTGLENVKAVRRFAGLGMTAMTVMMAVYLWFAVTPYVMVPVLATVTMAITHTQARELKKETGFGAPERPIVILFVMAALATVLGLILKLANIDISISFT